MHLRNKPIKLLSVICSHYAVVLLQHLICPLEFSFSHSMTFIKRLHSKYLCQFDACKTFEPCKKNKLFLLLDDRVCKFVSSLSPHTPFFFFWLWLLGRSKENFCSLTSHSLQYVSSPSCQLHSSYFSIQLLMTLLNMYLLF